MDENLPWDLFAQICMILLLLYIFVYSLMKEYFDRRESARKQDSQK